MKTTKLITMLILLAIISFSCGEEKATITEEDKDSVVELSNNPEDYLFKENSTYTYLENGFEKFDGVKYDVIDRVKNINTEEYFNVNNRKSLEIGSSQFVSADSSAIHSHGEFFYFSKITMNKYDWLLTFDITKESWTIFEREVKDSTGKLILQEKSIGKKGNIIEFEFNSIKYKGYEFTLETNTNLVLYVDGGNTEENIVTTVKETVHLVNSLGMVYYAVNYNYKELISGKENLIEKISILSEINNNF